MNLTEAELLEKLKTDPDFVNLKRFDYSLEKVLQRYENGAPLKVIAQALMLSEDQVENIYQQIIAKLREKLT